MDYLQYLSGVIITCLIMAMIAPTLIPELQSNRKFRFLVDYGSVIRICRILQYIALGLVGSKNGHKGTLYHRFSLRRYCRVESLLSSSTMFKYSIKVLRFLKATQNIRSIRQAQLSRTFQNLPEGLLAVSQYCNYFSDICDAFFYFTDHYELLRIVGVTTHKGLSQSMSTLSNVACILGGLLLFISGLCTLVKTQLQYGLKARQKSLFKYSLIKIVSNASQFAIGLAFLSPGVVSTETIAAMTLVSCFARLSQFRLIKAQA